MCDTERLLKAIPVKKQDYIVITALSNSRPRTFSTLMPTNGRTAMLRRINKTLEARGLNS